MWRAGVGGGVMDRCGWWRGFVVGAVAAALGGVLVVVGAGCAGSGTSAEGGDGGGVGGGSGWDAGEEAAMVGSALPEVVFREDPIEGFGGPIVGIEGRSLVLVPVPPVDLEGWWTPPVPTIAVRDDPERRLGVGLHWLAARRVEGAGDLEGWLGAGSSFRWSSIDAEGARRLARSARADERARLGEAGYWVVLVDGARAGDRLVLRRGSEGGSAGAGEVRIGVRWLGAIPDGAIDLRAVWAGGGEGVGEGVELGAEEREVLGRALSGVWGDPMQRWRVRLLSDVFGAGVAREAAERSGTGSGSGSGPGSGLVSGDDAVIGEIAAQRERVWREGLWRLGERDGALAGEVARALLGVASLGRGVRLPVWSANAGVESALLGGMLGDGAGAGVADERIGAALRGVWSGRAAMMAWVARDVVCDGSGGLDGVGCDAGRGVVRVAELQGRGRSATVGARTNVDLSAFGSSEVMVDLSESGGGGGGAGVAPVVVVRSGALSQRLLVAPRGAPVVAPGFRVGALWRSWTLDRWLNATPEAATVARGGERMPTTAALLTRDDLTGRWVLFVECLRDGRGGGDVDGDGGGDVVRVWLGGGGAMMVRGDGSFDSGGWDARLLDYRRADDRWSATLAIDVRGDEDGGETVWLALERREELGGGGVRVSSWPRPRLPGEGGGEEAPGSMGLDLSAWDRAFAGVASFEVFGEDDGAVGSEGDGSGATGPLP
ncbi:MAG: hypothetical protein ACTS3F_04645 [Phycisphaerales bacterium]